MTVRILNPYNMSYSKKKYSNVQVAFARDGGIPYSGFFSRTTKDGVPVQSLCLSTVLVIIFGLIYLGSSSALNGASNYLTGLPSPQY